MVRKLFLIVLATMMLQASVALTTYNYGPYAELFDYFNKYPMGAASVGDRFKIELEFPFGSSSGPLPNVYHPLILDADTRKTTELLGVTPIPLEAGGRVAHEWTVEAGQEGTKYFRLYSDNPNEYVVYYVTISKVADGQPDQVLGKFVDTMKRTDQFSTWKVIRLSSADRLSLDFTASAKGSFRLIRITDQRTFALQLIENNINSGTFVAPSTGDYAI